MQLNALEEKIWSTESANWNSTARQKHFHEWPLRTDVPLRTPSPRLTTLCFDMKGKTTQLFDFREHLQIIVQNASTSNLPLSQKSLKNCRLSPKTGSTWSDNDKINWQSTMLDALQKEVPISFWSLNMA